ncbi:MAG: hypothetical protein PHF35_02235 [Candidatus Moranbacteria bacterium]|nr:hypothetical protein [Candidatus Moranbacteria bacterium]
MFLQFNTLFLSFLFAANLWAAATMASYSTWFGIVFSLIIVIWAKLSVGRWSHLILPAILVPASVFLLFLIDSPGEIRLFFILSTVVFYFSVLAGWRLKQYERDETAKAMFNLATIAALFIWYAAVFGWYLNVAFPIWGLMVIFAVVTFIAAQSSFFANQIDPKKRLIYSVFLAILIAQTAWIQNFWPFGYLTTSVITLIIFCVGWEIILSFFQGKLSARVIFFEILFLVGSAALILFSTKWYPVI